MDTIAFLTLLLGLTLGPQTIKMSAADSVKRIELRLDGAPAGTMTAPPWQATVDLGDALAPHRLTATAFDSRGEQVGTVEQKINTPRGTSEARIVLEPKKARVVWQSVASRKPMSMSADIDGVPVQINDDFTITFPKKLSTDTPHVLKVNAVTMSGDRVDATAVIGSAAAQAESQLTAVPLLLVPNAPKLDLATLLRRNSEPLKVVAIDPIPAEVILVRAPSTTESAMHVDLDSRTHSRSGTTMNMAMMQGVADRSDIHLGASDTVRFLWPMASEGVNARLFPSSHSMTTEEHGLRWLVAHVGAPDATELRYADAVAVAGLQAAGSRRPRAVVLILGSEYRDASALDPARARAYLAAMGVPLYVWLLKDEPAAHAWGNTVDISTPEKFRSAAEQFADDLSRQRIAWVQGDVLPNEVTSTAQGITLLTTQR